MDKRPTFDEIEALREDGRHLRNQVRALTAERDEACTKVERLNDLLERHREHVRDTAGEAALQELEE